MGSEMCIRDRYKLPIKTYGPVKLGGEVEFGPGAKGNLGVSASGSTEESECDPETCGLLKLGTSGSLALGVFAKVAGAVEYCNIFNEQDCDKLIAGEAEASSTINVGASADYKDYKGEKCTSSDCYSYSYGKAEFKANAQYKVEVGGLYKYQYQNEVSVTFGEAGSGGTCG